MKSGNVKKIVSMILIIGLLVGLGWYLFNQYQGRTGLVQQKRTQRPIPVEVTPIKHGSIELKRVFSGELEALAEFVVAPKVSGRVEHVMVNLADTVVKGQVVAQLDNDEYVQAVAQADADLLVAKANLLEAKSAMEIAQREFKRTESLVKSGISSDSDFDAARQDQLAKKAKLEVAQAQVAKFQSALETSKIRLGYTNVIADWTGGDLNRVVAERYVDEGQTVAANAPLMSIVELNPIVGVVYLTERDYALLTPGQIVSLSTDAFPNETFFGHIDWIAPVFRKSTRQARVEMQIDNPQHRLKPGMFIRAAVVLKKVDQATIVPEQALITREEQKGIFVVSTDGKSVTWQKVKVGILQGDQVQVEGKNLSGNVVVLGHQSLKDGSLITIPTGHRHNTGTPQK